MNAARTREQSEPAAPGVEEKRAGLPDIPTVNILRRPRRLGITQ